MFALSNCCSAPKVATAPTVHGIETCTGCANHIVTAVALQQHLPFTVLKPFYFTPSPVNSVVVATAPTVHGIETQL